MLFGQESDLETFQMEMNVIVVSVRWHFPLVYSKDAAVFSKSPADNIKQVRCVLRPRYEKAVKLELKKCKFFV